jgi:cytochrome bd ubiquinol oxidase subunit I
VLTNKVQLVTFPHVVTAAYMVGGAMIMAVALWHLRRKDVGADAGMYRKATRLGAVVTLVAGLLVAFTGDLQGKIMTEVQPMKMAAAEALYTTADSCAPFSLFTVGSLDGSQEKFSITVPCLLSFLADGNFNGSVQGINDLEPQYVQKYGSGNPLTASPTYMPNIPLAYWSFRFMIGVGLLAALLAALALWATRKGRIPEARWWQWAIIAAPLLPVFGNSFGWIFTETGRQPWLVFGLMTTRTGVSPSVSAGEVVTSMVVYTLLYGALAVVEVKLFLRYARAGADPFEEPVKPSDQDEDAPLAFAY